METNTESGPPNLDAMEPDALMTFWHRIYCHPRRRARELFPAMPPGAVRAAKDLSNYAANKAAAMRCRAAGGIDRALAYEQICETIYNRLPTFARW